tara:strand:- start:4181 stop:4843 length:663 start_codon:yes stop_codon:yes gene_type:complete
MAQQKGLAVLVVAILLFIAYKISNAKLLGYGKRKPDNRSPEEKHLDACKNDFDYRNNNDCPEPVLDKKLYTSPATCGMKGAEMDYPENTNGFTFDNVENTNGVAFDHVENPVDPMSDGDLLVGNCANGLNNNSPYITILTGSPLNPTAILQFLSNMRNGYTTQNGCDFLRKRQWRHHSDLFQTTASSSHIGNPNHREQKQAKLDFLTATIKNCCEFTEII